MNKVKLTKIALLSAALLSRGMNLETGGMLTNGFVTANRFDNKENTNKENMIEGNFIKEIKEAADNPTNSNLNKVANILNNYTDEAKNNLIIEIKSIAKKGGLDLKKIADLFKKINQPALGFQLVGA